MTWTVDDVRQMADAPSDAYSAGAWCQAVGVCLTEIYRLREALEEILALRENKGQIGLPTAWAVAERALGPEAGGDG